MKIRTPSGLDVLPERFAQAAGKIRRCVTLGLAGPGGEQLPAGWRKTSATAGSAQAAERGDGLFVEDGGRFGVLDAAHSVRVHKSIIVNITCYGRLPPGPAAGIEPIDCCSGSTENPGESFQTHHPCGRGALGPTAPGTRPPGLSAFACVRPYFFLAARPRPAGAARNEIPVRIAFC
jgi:hypothetical protein